MTVSSFRLLAFGFRGGSGGFLVAWCGGGFSAFFVHFAFLDDFRFRRGRVTPAAPHARGRPAPLLREFCRSHDVDDDAFIDSKRLFNTLRQERRSFALIAWLDLQRSETSTSSDAGISVQGDFRTRISRVIRSSRIHRRPASRPARFAFDVDRHELLQSFVSARRDEDPHD